MNGGKGAAVSVCVALLGTPIAWYLLESLLRRIGSSSTAQVTGIVAVEWIALGAVLVLPATRKAINDIWSMQRVATLSVLCAGVATSIAVALIVGPHVPARTQTFFYSAVLCGAPTAAIIEELLFRGIGIGMFSSIVGNEVIAGASSCAAFALLHQPATPNAFLFYAGFGAGMWALYRLTRVLAIASLVHWIWDVVAVAWLVTR